MAFSNHFLDSLRPGDLAALEPVLQARSLERGDVLSQGGDRLAWVYLPRTCILSVIVVMSNGEQVESRTIGRESGYGFLHALGSSYAYEKMEVQVSGDCWRLPIEALARRAAESPDVVKTIVEHAQATLVQSALAVACNTLHPARSRLCRWLLMTQDRLGSDTLPLTQEHLSIMLGTQRTTVTALARELAERKLIAYSRGKIRILDRGAVEAGSCECYGRLEEAVHRHLGPGAGKP